MKVKLKHYLTETQKRREECHIPFLEVDLLSIGENGRIFKVICGSCGFDKTVNEEEFGKWQSFGRAVDF